MRRFFLVILVLSFALSSSAQPRQGAPDPERIKRIAPHFKLGPSVSRAVYAPLVRSAEFPHASLALNNRSPQPAGVSLTFFSKNGQAYGPVLLQLPPSEVKHFDVADLLPTPLRHVPELGGILASYTGQWNMVAAQLTLISASRAGSLDQPLRPATDFASHLQNAVWYVPKGGKAAVVVGNSTEQDAEVMVEISGQDAESKVIRAYETETFPVKGKGEKGELDQVMSAKVTSAGPAGAIRALGFVTYGSGYGHTIRFYDRVAVRQPDLFAANVTALDSEIQITLKNVGDKPLVATPFFYAAGSPTQQQLQLLGMDLQPGEEKLVDASALSAQAQLGNGLERVSVHIKSTGEKGSLIGSLSTFNRRLNVAFEVPLRDSGGLRNSGGSYPVRVDGDFSTVVSILNVSIDPIEFIGTIRYAGGSYGFRPRKLHPGESALFDIKDLRDHVIPDAYGKPLPKDFEKGQFNWSMFNGASVPKLIGRSQIVSLSRGISSSYSCPVCCPDSGNFMDANPGALTLFVNWTQAFSVNGSSVTCYGQWGYWPESVNWNHQNPSIAIASMVEMGTAQAQGNGVGQTVERSDPYTSITYLDDGMDCYPFYDENTLEESVAVGPKINFIDPTRGLKGTTVSVVINGADFQSNSTVQAGTGITVTITQFNSSEIRANFNISSTAPAGNHAVKVVGPPPASLESNSVNFFVQVPTSLSLTIGPKITYNGNDMIECDGTNDGPRWGYSRCLTYQLLDQNNPPNAIQADNLIAEETFQLISSNPPGIQHNNSNNSLAPDGTFQDFLAFVSTGSPGPQAGQFVIEKQTLKINVSGTTYTVRINCLNFQYNDVTVTNITGGGTCQ